MRVIARALTPLLVAASLAASAAVATAQNAAAALAPAPNATAVVLVDPRLYSLIQADLDAYVSAAAARRGFTISTVALPGLDDLAPAQVKAKLVQWRAADPSLEGVLFVGNVKLPTFFAPRADMLMTEIFPRFYEDLDMVATRQLAPGSVIQDVNGNPFTVPAHDFDAIDQGPAAGPELWAAFLPVGFSDRSLDGYASWAEQLRPALRKALAAHRTPDLYSRDAYIVSGDAQYMAEARPIWDAVGPDHIGFYAVNDPAAGCTGYSRAPLASFPTLDAFMAHDRTLAPLADGWQDPAIFLGHMAQENPALVTVLAASNAESSLVSSSQARGMTGGGKIAFLAGGLVGALEPPGASGLDMATAVDRDVLVSLVYGRSRFVAALGSVQRRTQAPLLEGFYASLYRGDYLGRAQREKMHHLDASYPGPAGIKGHQEILVGDPFACIGDAASPAVPSFADVLPDSAAFAAVEALHARGIFAGYADHTFRPSAAITRGQLCKVLVLAYGAPLVNPPVAHFSDVPVGSTFFPYVETALAQGWVTGRADGTFAPNAGVTRGQLCKLLVRAAGYPLLNPATGHFADVPPGSALFGFIETAVAHDLVCGTASGTFEPGALVTRGEVAATVFLAVP